MCGIAGFYAIKKDFKTENGSEILKDMCDSIITRGPDAFGYWIDQEESVFLGHRRLSILELSDAGKQPMISENKKFVIIFNGEIYNHLLIRQEIEKQIGTINWRGLSDTETILAGFELWGVEKTIQKLIGMFAFAVWNTEEKSFTLGRDRVGEKPLYYGWLSDNENKNI
jgi:asparagine synthase (glutamine-hydrolysing)